MASEGVPLIPPPDTSQVVYTSYRVTRVYTYISAIGYTYTYYTHNYTTSHRFVVRSCCRLVGFSEMLIEVAPTLDHDDDLGQCDVTGWDI